MATELKTNVQAADGAHDLWITRHFDLPVARLFQAFTAPELVAQWMRTKVLVLDCRKNGHYHFETPGPKGTVFELRGVIHDFVPNQSIVRTFEMAPTPFGVQLEFLQFGAETENTSNLRMHVVYESNEHRQNVLKQGFLQGIDMAHNRIQDIFNNSN